jgi:hypothetical protein
MDAASQAARRKVDRMRRGGAELIVCLLILLAALNAAQAQVGFDRLGGDYANFPLRSGDPAQCALRCERDQRCRAWAFSYPVTENAAAICWLKSRVTPRVAAGCCISGVRGAGVIEPRSDPIEFGIDRFGGDYRNLDIAPDPTGKSCAAACVGEAQCRAWTYARPGYVCTSATCFLKDRVTSPQHRPCCISGVVR